MYEDDTPTGGPSRIRADLVREIVFSDQLRPQIPRSLALGLEAKLRRVHPGYAPRDARELLDWVVERVVIPVGQWRELLAALGRDTALDPAVLVRELSGKLVAVLPTPGAPPTFVAALENLGRIAAAMETTPGTSSPLLDGAPARAIHRVMQRSQEGDEGDPLAELLADVLRFSGPVAPVGLLAELFGVSGERAEDALGQLLDAQRVVVGELLEGEGGPHVCDADNLERLLRMKRAAARPEFAPVPLDRLPLFLAHWQRLPTQGANAADLKQALERLFGLQAPVEMWEGDLLPARLDPYVPGWLDALMAETGLLWLGTGKERATFLLAADRELLADVGDAAAGEVEGAEPAAPPAAGETGAVFPHPDGAFAFEDLVGRSGGSSACTADELWRLAWQGRASTDTFEPVRRGIASGFKPAVPGARAWSPGRGARRLSFDRWQASRPFSGRWFPLSPVSPPADALEAGELAKGRARLLLDRYGVVFRELLEREAPTLRWGRVFRALRLMELSGEVVAGQFLLGPGGLQFASREALRLLRDDLVEDRIWWMNACDPASPCGLAVGEVPWDLPRRVPSSHLVFHGSRLVLSSERHGRTLAVAVGPDHPLLPSYLTFLKVFLTRPVRPPRAVVVAEINGEPAAASPYRQVLASLFHATRDRTSLRLSRRY
jgi:ATP-dependent Lhr-like helicase